MWTRDSMWYKEKNIMAASLSSKLKTWTRSVAMQPKVWREVRKHCTQSTRSSLFYLDRRVRGREICSASSPELNLTEGQGETSIASVSGRVVSHRANFVHVEVDDSGLGEAIVHPKRELLCVTRQVLKKMKRNVLVGDLVQVSSIDWTLGHGVVQAVTPRKSIFYNPPVANVDMALLMFSLKNPPIEPNQVNQFLVTAEAANLLHGVTVVMSKSDLVPDEEVSAWVQRLKSWGYDAIPISTKIGIGVEEVCKALEGRLGVIVGPSGVGKSSLINAINTMQQGRIGPPKDLEMKEDLFYSDVEELSEVQLLDVGEVSARTGRGKHTTRNISLIKLANGGLLADTPGFNQPSLTGITPQNLPACFPEITAKIKENKCQFKNCTHRHEPGCVVGADWERYEMYADMYDQVKAIEDQAIKMGAQKESREGDAKKKSREGGKVTEEPKLNRKKHRRASRKLTKQQWKHSYSKGYDDLDDQ